jgi:hypothetical protein
MYSLIDMLSVIRQIVDALFQVNLITAHSPSAERPE